MPSDSTNLPSDEEAYLRNRLKATEQVVKLLESYLAQTQARLETLDTELRTILHSGGWKWARRFYVVKDMVFPPNTRRRDALGWMSRQLTFNLRKPRPVHTPDPYVNWQNVYEPDLLAKYPEASLDPAKIGPIRIIWLDQPGTIDNQTDPNFTTSTMGSAAATMYLHHSDRLPPRAINILRQELATKRDCKILTFDEDRLDETGKRIDPLFKPTWSPDFILESDYIGNAVVFRGEVTEKTPYEEVLKRTADGEKPEHLSLVLLHRQEKHDGRVLSRERQEAVLRFRTGITIEPESASVRYPLQKQPLISILIPSKDQPEVLERCVESILSSSYKNFEILIIDNQSQTISTKQSNARLATRPGVQVHSWDYNFNFASINNFGVRLAKGEYLLFLNNDTQILTVDWLERLLEHAQRPEVGMVGAKLLYPNNHVQHAGVVIGMNHRTAGHVFKFSTDTEPGYLNRLITLQNYQAVTGACTLMRREVFEEVNGYDPQFAVEYNDIDLCLRLCEKGYRILMTPHVRLYHYEGYTRGTGLPRTPDKRVMHHIERQLYMDRWAAIIDQGDPFYSPNLSYSREDVHVKE
jgi:O-antigen biosynthesis protein